jgi:hypothetical protein
VGASERRFAAGGWRLRGSRGMGRRRRSGRKAGRGPREEDGFRGGGLPAEERDTITSCTRRASSHFKPTLHEAVMFASDKTAI